MTNPVSGARKKRTVLLCLYGAALVYFILKMAYFAFFAGGFPDQTAQVSYLIEMCRGPQLLPDFAKLPLYSIVGRTGMTRQMIADPTSVNYLGHPPLYYLLLSLTGPVRFLADGTAEVDFLKLYISNILLTAAGAVLAFRLGYRRLQDRQPLIHLLFAMAIATLPELGYVGPSINNDNLAFFAFALFFTGVLRYDEGKQDLRTYLLIGIGFLLGSFSKLTTALVMLIMLVVILVMSVIRTKSLKLIANRYFLATLPCYLLFLTYEILVYRRYGGWQPGLALVAPDYFRTSVFYVAPENRAPLTVGQYAGKFLGGIGYTWGSLYGHNGSINDRMNNGVAGLVYWIPAGASVCAAVIQAVRKKADRYTIPAVLAFLGTLAYHFWTGWSGFLKNGYTGGAQARYYLPLVIPFALIFCEQFFPDPKTKKARIITVAIAVLLVILWLAGDAPRLVPALGFSPA